MGIQCHSPDPDSEVAMTAHERKGNTSDEYQPVETIILDEDAVMGTDEFRTLLDPDEYEPPAQDFQVCSVC
jgi:hypothetical protein